MIPLDLILSLFGPETTVRMFLRPSASAILFDRMEDASRSTMDAKTDEMRIM